MQHITITIEQSKIDVPTLKIEQYYIHSKYNPIKEAQQFAEKQYESGKLHIIFGNGLGYYSEAFKDISTTKEDLIVFEPFNDLPESNNEFVYTNLESFKKSLKEKIEQFKEITLISIPNYTKLAAEQHKLILNYAKDQVLIKKIYENTINRYADDWQANYLTNLLHTANDFKISDLHKKYTQPVIVAAAGPSLSKQIPLITEYRDKLILVAAGSSITALMKHNLEPDYVVTMDGGLPNAKHFKAVTLSKAKLVYSLVTHLDVRENITSEKCYHYLSTDIYELEPHYTKFLGEQPLKLAGGGSVATYALSFANYISSAPIALVGQDLAYTNNQSHDSSNRYSIGLSEAYIQKNELFVTKDMYGNDIYTDHSFLAMKEAFNTTVEQVDVPTNVFNCTEGGLNIENIQNDTLVNFIKANALSIVDHNVITDTKYNITTSQITEQFQLEANQFKQAIRLVEDNLKLLKSTETIRKFKPTILTKMDKNEKELFKITKDVSIAIALQKVMIKFMKADTVHPSDTEYTKYKKVYEQNELLYNELKVILGNTLNIINELINKDER